MANLYGTDDNPIIETLIDGVWTDVSSRVRGEQKVTIIRGSASEQTRTTAQRANLTFENADGYFSNRLPTSPNYRKFGKNTQVRIRAGRGDNYLRLPYNDETALAHVSTADKAVLDITGDIDIRIDAWAHTWRPVANMALAAKYSTISNQRSWIIGLTTEGKITVLWSPDGTLASLLSATSSAVIPAGTQRIAIRVSIDVNNGSGSRVITFATAPTIGGTYTTLGSVFTVAGTTSIHGGTAGVTVGGASSTRGAFSTWTGLGGKVYGFELRSGLSGTLVARMDATSRSIGDTSWSDGLGTPNTWTVSGVGSRITSDRVRFWGELGTLKPSWDISGNDVTIPAQAYGLLRRLSQGAKSLEGPMVRNFKQHNPYGWWPLEDGSGATSASNLSPGINAIARPASVTAVNFGTSDRPPGATGSLQFTGSTSRFSGRASLLLADSPAVYSIVFYVKLSALPGSEKIFCQIAMNGQLARIDIGVSPTVWSIVFYDITGSVVASSTTSITGISPADGWVGYNLLLKEVGSDVTYSQRWDVVGVGLGGGVGPTTISGYSLEAPNRIAFTPVNDAVFNDMRLSHIFLSNQDLDLSNNDFRDASNAYRGETAAARLVRLSAEEGVPMEVTGRYVESEPMGYQSTKTYPDLIAECWETDGGAGGEARDALTLAYRTRADMERREDVVLNYDLSDLSEVPKPTDDDLGLMNDVTVTRPDGGSARSVITDGYSSVSEPPAGVGRYEAGFTLNAATDERLPSIAGWLALVGTWDQDRYPSVAVALHRSRVLADDVLFASVVSADLGDTILLKDLPSWMPPDDVPEIIQGYTEVLSRFMWEINATCTPAGPHQAVAQLGSDVYVPRLDATGHTVSNSLTTTSTSLTLVTPAGSARWVDSATYPTSFPMEIVIGGEVMNLTEVTGTSSPQAGTVTRSINGVVKSHSANQSVRLARPFYIGR